MRAPDGLPASPRGGNDVLRPASRFTRLEIGGVLGLGVLALFFIVTSWRKWPDPLVDFGIQLYAPWRISHGDLLYRDIDYLYGPFSPYLNATLFACCGTSLLVLVIANLVIFAGIVACLYRLCRTAWGAGAACAASAVFIAVFGFSQFVGTGNYNFATPYAHETTHGFLVCLVLALVLILWVENATPRLTLSVGLLFGLTFILKPEIILAGGLSLGVALAARYRFGKLPPARVWTLLILGTALPTVAFFLYFAAFLPWNEAASGAGRAWLNVVSTSNYISNTQQQNFLGFDRLSLHLEQHVIATFWAGLLIGLISAAAWQINRMTNKIGAFLIALLSLALISWIALSQIDWIETGRCLTGLTLLYFATCLASLFAKPEKNRRQVTARLLLATLALAFLARMLLHARLYQFGYYQAALAASIIPAILIGEFPQRLGLSKNGTGFFILGTLVLFIPGVVILAGKSQLNLSYKTTVIGGGGDRFYAFSPQIDPTGEIVVNVLHALQNSQTGQTLLVLPQGMMLNYLARLPGPNAPCGYFHTAEDEAQTVRKLEAHPPDYVVIISQELRGFGIQRYGDQPNEGQQVLAWVNNNYEVESSVGGDPLDPRQRGAEVLKHK